MCQHLTPRKEGESSVPLPFSTLSLRASGNGLCSFPRFVVPLPWGLVGKGSGWEGRRAGCRALLCATFGPLSILSLPDSVPQHPNRIQHFLFSHPLYVTVGPFCVCGQWKSKLLFLGMSKCCWDTESGKPLQEKNQQWINGHRQCLSGVILDVSSSCREHERVKQGLGPDGRQNLFNFCFNLCLLVQYFGPCNNSLWLCAFLEDKDEARRLILKWNN